MLDMLVSIHACCNTKIVNQTENCVVISNLIHKLVDSADLWVLIMKIKSSGTKKMLRSPVCWDKASIEI